MQLPDIQKAMISYSSTSQELTDSSKFRMLARASVPDNKQANSIVLCLFPIENVHACTRRILEYYNLATLQVNVMITLLQDVFKWRFVNVVRAYACKRKFLPVAATINVA